MATPQNHSRNPGIPFDPLQYVHRLEKVGFTREQAETFLEIVREQLLSKQDLKELEVELREVEVRLTQQIKELDGRLTQQVKELDGRLTQQIKELDGRLTQQIKELDGRLTQQIKELEAKTMLQMEVLKRDLKIWFGGMLVTLIVVSSALQTMILHWIGH